jgi:hypothetical protein
MLASVAKTLTNTSLRKVFEKYALELVAKQHNGKERAEQLRRAFKSSTVKRDTMLCSRRTSGPLKCPYAGGNCTIKWDPSHCLVAFESDSVAGAPRRWESGPTRIRRLRRRSRLQRPILLWTLRLHRWWETPR